MKCNHKSISHPNPCSTQAYLKFDAPILPKQGIWENPILQKNFGWMPQWRYTLIFFSEEPSISFYTGRHLF